MIWTSHTPRFGLFGMLPVGLMAAAVLCFADITAAWGQQADTGSNTPATAEAPDQDVPVMDRTVGAQVFPIVEGWMRRGEVPEQSIAYPVRRVAAVAVTIRIERITLGTGTAAIDRPLRAAADRSTDVVTLLQQATRQAMEEAEQSLDRLELHRAENRSVPRTLREAGPLLQLDLQFAGPLHRLSIDRASDVVDRMRIGLHGLAIEHGASWGWMFPGTAVAGNIRIESQVQRLLTAVGLDMTAMRQVGEENGPSLFRFDALHLMRDPDGNGEVRAYRRGQPVTEPRGVDLDEITALRQLWAAHLLSRQRPDGRFTGTYLPTSDQYRPDLAPPRDSALAVLALGRLAAMTEDPARAGLYRQAAEEGLTAVLEDLQLIRNSDETSKGRSDEQGRRTVRTAEAAIALIALLEVAEPDAHTRPRERLAGLLTAAMDADGWVRNASSGSAPRATPGVQALASYALTLAFERTETSRYERKAQQGLAVLWSEMEIEQSPSAFPLGPLAELHWLRMGRPQPGLLTVVEAMGAAWQQQVEPPEQDAPRSPEHPDYTAPDTVGGFLLNRQLVPEPTWQSANVVAGLAAAPRARNVVDTAERGRWLIDTARAFAFLDRLTFDAADTWYVHRPNRAIGGVRTALWDNRLPLSATAMSLLAAIEWQRTIDALEE